MAGEPNSFENLTQSGLFRINSKDSKDVSLSLDVYMGNTSLVVFTGAGGRPWKISLPAKAQAMIVVLLEKMKAEPRPCREPMFINEWTEDNGKRKMQQKGCIGFGIDENLTFFIDVAANDLQGRHMFPFKPDGRYDFSNTSLSEKDTLTAMISWVIQTLSMQVSVAERISSFKRTGGGGGNFRGGGGGGGNRGNYGGGGSGGYNNQNANQQQSGTFGGGGGADVADDLHV